MTEIAQPPKTTAQSAIKLLPVHQKALALTSCLTIQEFLGSSPAVAPLLLRRYHEIRIPLAEQTFFLTYPDVLHFIVVVNEESPDTLVVLPILMRLAAASPRFQLGILREYDDFSLLDGVVDEIDFQEDLGEIDLPLLLIFDEEWDFQGQWVRTRRKRNAIWKNGLKTTLNMQRWPKTKQPLPRKRMQRCSTN